MYADQSCWPTLLLIELLRQPASAAAAVIQLFEADVLGLITELEQSLKSSQFVPDPKLALRQVLQQSTERQTWPVVTTLHLLDAILAQTDRLEWEIAQRHGLDRNALQAALLVTLQAMDMSATPLERFTESPTRYPPLDPGVGARLADGLAWSYHWEHLSPAAQAAFWRARDQALARHQDMLGADHLLLGLLGSRKSLAHKILMALNVDRLGLWASTSDALPLIGDRPLEPGPMQIDPALTLALKQAERIMLRRHSRRLGTPALLLGLLADKSELTADCLKYFGITTEKVSAQYGALRRRGVAASHRQPKPDDLPLEQMPDVADRPVTAHSQLYGPMPRDRFSVEAQRAIKIAADEAQQHGATELTPIHLLLGILTNKAGQGSKVLRLLGIATSTIQTPLRELLTRASSPTPVEAFSTETASVLAEAWKEARHQHSEVITSAELLVGLSSYGGISVQNVLRMAGVTPEAIRKATQTASPPAARDYFSLPRSLAPRLTSLRGLPDTIPFDQLTTPALSAILHAADLATVAATSHITLEMLVLGLLQDPTHAAGLLLFQLEVDCDDYREQLEMDWDPRGKAVASCQASTEFAAALKSAADLQDLSWQFPQITTVHLLYAAFALPMTEMSEAAAFHGLDASGIADLGQLFLDRLDRAWLPLERLLAGDRVPSHVK